jgi:broad specificity phosphatase PhoE
MEESARRPSVSVHLVRHGEVENPKGVVYGRLPGYNLSERGLRQAAEAARRLQHADIGVVRASPLERAQETAGAIAALHGLDVVTDERLTESATTLEGITRDVLSLLRSPAHLWSFRNPLRPSWGETFGEIRTRMFSALSDALAEAGGREVVLVSHQTPVLVTRLALARRRLPPWLAGMPCETGSVTTLVLNGAQLVRATYFRPSA